MTNIDVHTEAADTRVRGPLPQTPPSSNDASSSAETAGAPDAATQRFAERVLGDLSAAMTGVMVRVGHELGLYRALGEHGPLT